jgi:hypothetical protein
MISSGDRFISFAIYFLFGISSGGWLVGYWESAIQIFCVCLALMAIDLKMSDLEIEILRMHQRLLKHQISTISEPFGIKDEVDQEVE